MRAVTSAVAVLAVLSLVALAGARDAEAGLVLSKTYVVDTTADDPTLNQCTAAAGDCSLRGAIGRANGDLLSSTINFAIGIGSKTIVLSSVQGPLPAITASVLIDGTTQICAIANPHPPCISVNGAALTNPNAVGLEGRSTGVNIKNLAIGFFHRGIQFRAGGGGTVTSSYVGTFDGTSSAANGNSGVAVNFDAGAVIIGGPSASDGNVISGNDHFDVLLEAPGTTLQNNLIGTNFLGTEALLGANSVTGVLINGGSNSLVASNLVSGHAGLGIAVSVGQGNVIAGNLIGTNAAGDVTIPNGVGVEVIQGASNTLIGGDSEGARNVISGNTNEGILIEDGANTVISGNYVGTDSSGAAAIPNSTGIKVGDGSAHTTIGGASAGARNVISGNNPLNGIFVTGASTVISGNFIGTDAGGDIAVPNGGGIALFNATDAVVGGDSAAERNVVAGGSTYGISLLNVSGAVISGNYVGVDSAGSVALPNGDGIVLSRSSSNQIVGNVTSGNTGAGIRVQTVAGNPSLDNNLTDNIIGLNAAGSSAVPNGGAGIQITNADGGAATGNTISQNSIDGNGGLGIDIQSTDPIPPPPALSDALAAGNNAHVNGQFSSSLNNQTVTIEFFASPACDTSGSGEGRAFLAAKDVNTNGVGDAAINVNVPQAPAGQVITATATDENGSTSEFSNCVVVTGPTPTPSPSPSATPNGGVQGDANCNGQMDSGDVIAALSEFVGVPPGTACPDTADADCDGDVDPDDALRITRFLADVALPQPSQCPQIGTQT